MVVGLVAACWVAVSGLRAAIYHPTRATTAAVLPLLLCWCTKLPPFLSAERVGAQVLGVF